MREESAQLLYPPRVTSGIQPTRSVHMGHYFGVLKHQLLLHHQYPGKCYFMVADYHALTRGVNPERIERGTIELTTVYLATGLDPEKAWLYRQSDVPEVMELAWILACVTPVGELTRNPVYREAKAPDSAGLLTYPVLMAADILVLRSTIVPVGKDQRPNLDTVRDIARRFNNAVDRPIFPMPEPRISLSDTIPGADGRKMSSDSENHIGLFLRYHELQKAVNSIVTAPVERYSPIDPDECTVFKLYALLVDEAEAKSMRHRYESGSIDFGEAKRALRSAIQEFFAKFEPRYDELRERPDYVRDVLRVGFMKVREQARETLDEVRSCLGLGH